MKKTGIINAQLMGLIAGLGHKDCFLIIDGGMPVPQGVTIVDLALTGGVPTFRQVFDSVIEETCIEQYYLAEEIKDKNHELELHINDSLNGIPHEYMPHDLLKERSRAAKFVIRTGEFSPYANVMLQAGVVF